MTKEELEKVRAKTCSTCKHFSKDVHAEEPCKSCYRQSYWEIDKRKMNEEELKNKCTERAKIFQQAMESCHSSSPMDCIEWFADRIAELEVTNKKISNECHKLVDSLEKKQNENELLETQNIKLQAEVSRLTIKNAELKLKLEALEGQTPWKDIKDRSELIKENKELKEALEGYKKIAKWCDKCDKIAELKLENQKWKDEWQEQVQKATDEGYARTLQTMQLSKAKELLKRFIETSNPIYFEEDRQKVKAEAEQFLKDSEVEK